MNTPFTSLVNLHTFRGEKIADVLRDAADWIESQNFPDSTEQDGHFSKNDRDDQYYLTLTGSYWTSTDLSQVERKPAKP